MNHALISALLLPSTYPEPTSQVDLVQTHVSCLFLTDTLVYKVKKAVNFGFLDFSTLKLRHHFCQEEVRLNSRLCPGMYLGVVPIVRTAAGFAIDTPGTVVEYAVRMQRLPADRMLNQLLEHGTVTGDEIAAVASLIARFHLAATTGPEIAGNGLPDVINANWAENIGQLPAAALGRFPAEELARIDQWGRDYLENNQALFAGRVAGGFIRDCDGDIHSENICLTEPIRIFDCIEFNSRFRYSDTAADLAFLLMDLDYHRRPELAEVAVATYTAITGDDEARQLFPYYKVYRALIRAKVEALRSLDPHCTSDERRAAAEASLAYLRLARGLTRRQALPPTLILTCGRMGCGKTTLAEALAFELGLPLVRSDLVRKELAGIAPATRVADRFGAGLYRREQTDLTYQALASRSGAALQGGASIIVDASFGDESWRRHFCRLAEQHGARSLLLYLHGSDDLHRERLRQRTATGGDASDGRIEIYNQQAGTFTPPTGAEAPVIRLDAARSLDDLIQNVHAALTG